ncbi:NACHT domain-containing protein [Leifsonia shinshuensis]|nr:NACHT domain-containing protein [Leifsonia shinshuensis]
MSKRSELAGSLAQVALSALGGPALFARTALSEGAKYTQAYFEEREQAREVRKRVAAALDAWAGGEKISHDELAAGLSMAEDMVREFGLDFGAIADLDFDADRVSSAVLEAAKPADRYWEIDSVQVLATRAVQETYDVLIAQLRAKNETSISLFLSLQKRFDELANAQATRGDIIRYLRGRIADWDTSYWRADLRASAIERALRFDETPRRSTDDKSPGMHRRAEDISRESMLVILGEPGSGKTWYLRMLARRAAQEALDELERGGSTTGIEIPLLTTWQRWADTPGDTTESLVASSFASGLGFTPLADRDMRERLEVSLLASLSRVVVMVDSLDEAADVKDQAARLQELSGLPLRWRVVISSRPAAWAHAAKRALVRRSPREITLRGLRYPTDVISFIRAWFAEPDEEWRADALLRELARRRDLVGDVVLPLFLTFYCLLAQGADRGAPALPQSARDLYRRLAARLLLGSWSGDAPGPDGQPDIAYCEELLRGWAWSTFRAQTRDAGGRPRDDSFVQGVVIRPAERRAIDQPGAQGSLVRGAPPWGRRGRHPCRARAAGGLPVDTGRAVRAGRLDSGTSVADQPRPNHVWRCPASGRPAFGAMGSVELPGPALVREQGGPSHNRQPLRNRPAHRYRRGADAGPGRAQRSSGPADRRAEPSGTMAGPTRSRQGGSRAARYKRGARKVESRVAGRGHVRGRSRDRPRPRRGDGGTSPRSGRVR